MNIDELKDKYPVVNGKDAGERLTIGTLVERIGQALDARGATKESAHEIAADVIDRDFLFGAWGWRWDNRDHDLLRDIRGIIISAYEAGKRKR